MCGVGDGAVDYASFGCGCLLGWDSNNLSVSYTCCKSDWDRDCRLDGGWFVGGGHGVGVGHFDGLGFGDWDDDCGACRYRGIVCGVAGGGLVDLGGEVASCQGGGVLNHGGWDLDLDEGG